MAHPTESLNRTVTLVASRKGPGLLSCRLESVLCDPSGPTMHVAKQAVAAAPRVRRREYVAGLVVASPARLPVGKTVTGMPTGIEAGADAPACESLGAREGREVITYVAGRMRHGHAVAPIARIGIVAAVAVSGVSNGGDGRHVA